MCRPALRPSVVGAACVLNVLCFSAPASAQPEASTSVMVKDHALYIQFHDPTCPYMAPAAINLYLAVTGTCKTPSGAINGFVRDPFGRFTIFNVNGSHTEAVSINTRGAVTGFYYGASGLVHGFLRSPDGTITSFDQPTTGVRATYPSAINDEDVITGAINFGDHPYGFMRSRDGTFQAVSVFANGVSAKAMVPFAINRAGIVAGTYFAYVTDLPQGFVRLPDGTNTFFSAGFSMTIPFGINRDGVVAGVWRNPVGNTKGFLRSPDGAVTSFELPGNVEPQGLIFVSRSSSGVSGGINAESVVTGTYVEADRHSHGYVRSSDGTLTTFALGPGNTTAVGINDFGVVTGAYAPNSTTSRGYLRLPIRWPPWSN